MHPPSWGKRWRRTAEIISGGRVVLTQWFVRLTFPFVDVAFTHWWMDKSRRDTMPFSPWTIFYYLYMWGSTRKKM
ncbi:Hypothetical predicted protein [Olea europaea subsp. europaea]|uniref:Uncharacterized protein n=1 Tax=Olea europaea subsp. europaea TaxID=158383 RepID=A0A8S0SUG5_OLEEU|nr:Hypothetical predicted protein [Olea europaea subsp. europaea]